MLPKDAAPQRSAAWLMTLVVLLSVVRAVADDVIAHQGFPGFCGAAYSALPIPRSKKTQEGLTKIKEEFTRRRIDLTSELSLKAALTEFALRSKLAGNSFDPTKGFDRGQFYEWLANHPKLKPAITGAGQDPYDVARLARIRTAARIEYRKARTEEMAKAGVAEKKLPLFETQGTEAEVIRDISQMFAAANFAEEKNVRGAKAYLAMQEILRDFPERLDPAEAIRLQKEFEQKVKPLLLQEVPLTNLLNYPVLTKDWIPVHTGSSGGLEPGIARGAFRSPDETMSIAFQDLPNGTFRIEGLRVRPDGGEPENEGITLNKQTGDIKTIEHNSGNCRGCHPGTHIKNGKTVLDLQATGLTKVIKEQRKKGETVLADQGANKQPMRPIQAGTPAYREIEGWLRAAREVSAVLR